jgi:hypothetical protein
MREKLWRKLRLVASAEKVPLLLPALLAFVAWGLTHISDRLLKSPTLEYDCGPAGKDTGDWECVIRNLSDDRVFRGLHFIVRFPNSVSGKIEKAEEIEWLGTAHHGQKDEPATQLDKNVEYKASMLNPGQAVRLKVRVSGESPRLEFRFWSEESSQAIRAVQSNGFTIAVRHEQEIILFLIGLAILLGILCIGTMRAEKESTGSDELRVVLAGPEEQQGRQLRAVLVEAERGKSDQ